MSSRGRGAGNQRGGGNKTNSKNYSTRNSNSSTTGGAYYIPPQMTWPCLICNDSVETENEVFDCLQCFGCKKWVHPKCAKISPNEYQDYCTNENKHWVCSPCVQENYAPVKDHDAKLDRLMEIIPLVRTIGTRMNDLEKHYQEISGPKLEAKIEEVVDKKIAQALEEQKDIDRRRKNLIVVNVKESTKKDLKMRNEDDLNFVRDLVREVVDIQDDDISDPLRFGDVPKKGEKPRVLRVSCKTEELKDDIVKNMREKNKTIPFQERIYFNTDYTRKQRETYNTLKKEVKARTDQGEANLGIRGSGSRMKIVTLKPKQRFGQGRDDDLDDGNDDELAAAAQEVDASKAGQPSKKK